MAPAEQHRVFVPQPVIVASPPVSTPTEENERSGPRLFISTPELIPDELRDVAPLLFGFEFTDDDVAAYERRHGLPQTTGMERFGQKFALLGKYTRELDIWMRAFFDARAARRPRTPNASREDIIYFAKRISNGQVMDFLCPSPERIEQLAQALGVSRPVRWIPV